MTPAAAAVSLLFTGARAACLVHLHLAPTGLSPVRDAVSAYGIGAYRRWYPAQAVCAAVAALCLALALRHGPAVVVTLLVVFAAGRLAITQFPMDVERAVHWLLATIAFVSIAAAAIHLKRPDYGTPALGWVMIASLVAGSLARRVAFGLAERGFYVAMLAWLALVAARLA